MINIIKNFKEEPQDNYVYLHKRKTDGVVFYVGKGKNYRYKSKSERSSFWYKICNKHGVVVDIVQDKLQEWAALELEKELIALYGRRDLNLGELVNHTDGGEGKCGAITSKESNIKRSNKLKGRMFSEEHRRLIGLANQKRVVSDETKNKISLKHTGKYAVEDHPRYGKKKSLESIEKTAAKTRIKVICIETGEIFKSVTDAAKSVFTATTCISRVCKGKQETSKGFTWKYLNSGDPREMIEPTATP